LTSSFQPLERRAAAAEGAAPEVQGDVPAEPPGEPSEDGRSPSAASPTICHQMPAAAVPDAGPAAPTTAVCSGVPACVEWPVPFTHHCPCELNEPDLTRRGLAWHAATQGRLISVTCKGVCGDGIRSCSDCAALTLTVTPRLGDIMALAAATDTYDRPIPHAKLTHVQMVARSDSKVLTARICEVWAALRCACCSNGWVAASQRLGKVWFTQTS
jgi:hypothetical protein